MIKIIDSLKYIFVRTIFSLKKILKCLTAAKPYYTAYQFLILISKIWSVLRKNLHKFTKVGLNKIRENHKLVIKKFF